VTYNGFHGNNNGCQCDIGCSGNGTGKGKVILLTKGAKIVSPNMVSFEIVNALTKMMKERFVGREQMLNMFEYYDKILIRKIEVDFGKALQIA